MTHLLCLCVALLLTFATSAGLSPDTASTGFAITWLVMFLCCEFGWFLITSETAS